MTKFEKQCREVSEATDVDVVFFHDEPGSTEANEDDGNLHVRKRGVRACFSVDPEQDNAELSNERTRDILTRLGMSELITDSVIVEENDGEYCPNCGERLN